VGNEYHGRGTLSAEADVSQVGMMVAACEARNVTHKHANKALCRNMVIRSMNT